MPNSTEIPQKVKNGTTIRPSCSTHGSLKNTKTQTQKDIWAPMVSALLFTVAKIWSQPQRPLMGDWIKKMWRIHSGISSNHKKYETLHSWHHEGSILSEMSHTHTVWFHSYVESKRLPNKWTHTVKQKQTDTEIRIMVTGGRGLGTGRMGKGGQLHRDGWSLDLWRWSLCTIYRCWIIMPFAWNLH